MLTRTEFNTVPEVQPLIDEIISENSRYDRDLRTCHREDLVCPVTIVFPSSEHQDQHCVSRNISTTGLSVVSSVDFNEKTIAVLDIYRLANIRGRKIVAECKWSKPFGEKYWMSGWQFMRLQKDS